MCLYEKNNISKNHKHFADLKRIYLAHHFRSTLMNGAHAFCLCGCAPGVYYSI